MPNLRLSDQEAADITAYIMEDPDGYFRDVPEGWAPKRIEMPEQQLREVLGEQARWFFARDGRATIEERLEKGAWKRLPKSVRLTNDGRATFGVAWPEGTTLRAVTAAQGYRGGSVSRAATLRR